jgi:hypothetical protein
MYENIQPGPSIWDIRFITAIAFGFLAISMICNVVFYSAFGNGGHSLLYAIIGLFFDFGKVGLIALIAYLMRYADRHDLPIPSPLNHTFHAQPSISNAITFEKSGQPSINHRLVV